nr:MFS transporter [Vallitaleaceae bacterium]
VTSSLLSGRIIKWFGTGKVTFASCLMTGAALFGFSIAPSYIWLLFLAIPLGFGGGSVDAALNNYVALHFKAHHMNWLHSFWGVGATMGPLILANILANGVAWQQGYRTIAMMQLSLAFILLITLPLWGKVHAKREKTNKDVADVSVSETLNLDMIDKDQKVSVIKIKGVKYALLVFMFYVTGEISIGLWGSSFLIQSKGVSIDTAAAWIAMYYGGIMVGRFISGFISFKLNNKQMIRLGIIISFIGTGILLLPIPTGLLFIPLMLIGLGFAPIFPSMIHETPIRFGKEHSQTIIGYEMAAAYTGGALIPPLFGVILANLNMALFPVLLGLSILVVYISSTRLLHKRKTLPNAQ